MPIIITVEGNQELVYSKTQIDVLLDIKADKFDGAVGDDIAILTAEEGNINDSGVNINDLIPSIINGGIF